MASDNPSPLMLAALPLRLAVCRADAGFLPPGWVFEQPFYAVTRTVDELSLVLPEDAPLPAAWRIERGWRCLKVLGPLDFALTGILAGISGVLAQANISIFALSTFDTDYILVKVDVLDRTVAVLRQAGYVIQVEPF